MPSLKAKLRSLLSKKSEVVAFSSTAIALYGYDQGMMSLINTNYSYLSTMGIDSDSFWVGTIVSTYYIGTALGALLSARHADSSGRKPAILVCELLACLGNMLMASAGFFTPRFALETMLAGRFIMGLGVGGLDAVIPVYSAELSEDDGRGRALAQEFQANIFGLLSAFALNLGLTHGLGKASAVAWRVPIVSMQVYPLVLTGLIGRLPESPRWLLDKGKEERAGRALRAMYDQDESQAEAKMEELKAAAEVESSNQKIGYGDMLLPSGAEFHPTMLTVMGQVNQALTGYGAVSVYGPQIFELLGFSVSDSEWLTLGNYILYFLMMTVAWLLIDRIGRRPMMVWGSVGLTGSFVLLTLLGGLADRTAIKDRSKMLAEGILGSVVLYVATSIFGIGWLSQVWLIPTEIYPSSARAQGAAISVVVWGVANFAVTFLTPLGFNGLTYWLFLCFAVTNMFAGWWTWTYSPETGGRAFEENHAFFEKAAEVGSWRVKMVDGGRFRGMPQQGEEKNKGADEEEAGERQPLLRRVLGVGDG